MILCLPDDAAQEAVGADRQSGRAGDRRLDRASGRAGLDLWLRRDGRRASARPIARLEAGDATPAAIRPAAIALVRPLVDAGLLPADWPLTVNAVSGYSGGGKGDDRRVRGPTAPAGHATTPFRIYAWAWRTSTCRRCRLMRGLAHPPLFAPAVGRYAPGHDRRGPAAAVGPAGQRRRCADCTPPWRERYAGEAVRRGGVSLEEAHGLATLDPEGLNGTNRHEALRVRQPAARARRRLVALLDNLGKGASGAAVQNLNLMLIWT